MRRVLATLTILGLLLGCTALKAGPAFQWPGRYKLLLSGLRSKDPKVRLSSVDRLASYPLARIEGPLLRMLDDVDMRVRTRAVHVLLDKGSSRLLPRLRAWLSGPNRDLRQGAMMLLTLIGDDSALDEAVRALRDMDPEVREMAVMVIRKLGPQKAVKGLLGALSDEAWEVRVSAATTLGVVDDPRAVIGLIGVLGDERPEVRSAAVKALGRIGDPKAAQAVLRSLSDADQKVRLAAVEALGNLDAPQVVDVLVDRVRRSRNPGMSAAALRSLGRLRTASAAAALVSLLSHLPRSMLSDVAHRLVQSGSVATKPIVARLAAPDTKPQEARRLVEILGRIQDSSASDALVKELHRGRVPMSTVLAALEHCADWHAVPALVKTVQSPEADSAMVSRVIAVLEHAADERSRVAVTRFFRSCRDCRVSDRVRLVTLLGRIHAVQALGDVVKLARSGPQRLRRAALEALAWFGDSKATDVLLDVLRRGPSSLRIAAADAAVSCLDRAGLAALLQLAQDQGSGTETRTLALRSAGLLVHRLGAHEAQALSLFVSALRGSLPLALAALDGLGAMRTSKALGVLTEMAFGQRGPRSVRCRAVEMLGAYPVPTLVPKLADMVQAQSDCAADAAWVLGKVGQGPRALGVVQRLFALAKPGSAVRRNLSASLGRLAVIRVRLALLRLLRDQDLVVRINALAGLARLGREEARVPEGWLKKVLGSVQSLGVLAHVAEESAAKLGFKRSLGSKPGANRVLHRGRGDWVLVQVVGEHGASRAGVAYLFAGPDGFVRSGRLGPDGIFHEERVQEGACQFLIRK